MPGERQSLFLVRFPATYRCRRYFTNEERANRFVDYVKEKYNIQGTVVPVEERTK